MTVDDIINNAKDSAYAGMDYNSRYRLYESYKNDIALLVLDARQYEQAIRRLCTALGV